MPELKIWAPIANRVEVELGGRRAPMQVAANGWLTFSSDGLRHGSDYALWVDGEGPFPDPRSASQPYGVDGPSRWVDHARFAWHDSDWQPVPIQEAIIYELHIGTFSSEGSSAGTSKGSGAGTFEAAIARLDALRSLGITHVEFMPLAEFAGTRGWGYDGASLFAPHHSYGGPEELKLLVDACHQRDLAVLIDVVYNHMGPVGNYLDRFGPYFKDCETPWGRAVNFDGADSGEVRRFFIDNALMWVRDYHVDGLRIDAVHAFLDNSDPHFLEQLVSEVKALGANLGRDLIIIAESDLNDPRVVRPTAQGGLGFDAQWNEDFHHALHALLTGEDFGYYKDFGKVGDLAKVLCANFCFDDRYSPSRPRHYGCAAAGLDGSRFVACLQNHDQTGNRGAGERIGHLVTAGQLKLGAAVLLLSPFVPLLFQGEEWAASSPFQYFTDFSDPELGAAVRKGRQAEFAAFGWDPGTIPDPQDAATWRRSQLNWSERETAQHREMLDWYGALVSLRKQHADFAAGPLDPDGVDYDESAGWLSFRRGRFLVIGNFSNAWQRVPCGGLSSLRLVLASDPAVTLEVVTMDVPGRMSAAVKAESVDAKQVAALPIDLAPMDAAPMQKMEVEQAGQIALSPHSVAVLETAD